MDANLTTGYCADAGPQRRERRDNIPAFPSIPFATLASLVVVANISGASARCNLATATAGRSGCSLPIPCTYMATY